MQLERIKEQIVVAVENHREDFPDRLLEYISAKILHDNNYKGNECQIDESIKNFRDIELNWKYFLNN